jgi:3'(2'), 5'-bisphosphate nucleotidase
MKKIVYLSLACLFLVQAQDLVCYQPTQQIVAFDRHYDRQLQDAKRIAKQAGQKILELRNAGLISEDVELANGKIVRQTNADVEASQLIFNELSKLYPAYGFISQDQMDADVSWYLKDSIWIVNSIDGTKEFEKGSSEFHVQIGLLDGNDAVIGVSYFPATDTYVWAVKGEGAWIEKDGIRERLIAGSCSDKILIKSSSYAVIETHFDEWNWTPSQIVGAELSTTGRLLAMIRGDASLYISLGASPLGKEKKGGVWNYGANVVIANEAGLILTTLSGNEINLREPSALLVEGIILSNDLAVVEKVLSTTW